MTRLRADPRLGPDRGRARTCFCKSSAGGSLLISEERRSGSLSAAAKYRQNSESPDSLGRIRGKN